MRFQRGIYEVKQEDFPYVLEVCEPSVHATHLFLAEADIQFFKPLVQDALSQVRLACVREEKGQVIGESPRQFPC